MNTIYKKLGVPHEEEKFFRSLFRGVKRIAKTACGAVSDVVGSVVGSAVDAVGAVGDTLVDGVHAVADTIDPYHRDPYDPYEEYKDLKAQEQGEDKAWNLKDMSPLQQARELFDKLDKNGNGKLTLWEIKQTIQFGGKKFSKETLRKMMTRFDQDENGVLGKDEFCRFYIWLYKRVQEFNENDTDHNRMMDADEFYGFVRSTNLSHNLSRKMIEKMVRKTLTSQEGHRRGLNLESFIKLRTNLFNLDKAFKKLSKGRNSVHMHYDEYLVEIAKALM